MKVGEAVWVFEPNTSLLQRLQATFRVLVCLLAGNFLYWNLGSSCFAKHIWQFAQYIVYMINWFACH